MRSNDEASHIYFIVNDVASKTLPIFDRDFNVFRNVVLRLAFSDDSPASKAVLQSLLAVSAMQRYGPSLEADQLKLSALSALKNSNEQGLDGHTGIQQVTAQLLLCAFEVGHQNLSYRLT